MKNDNNQQNQAQSADMSIWKWLLRFIQGVLIGGGAILPGISGGVLCVVFGIYQPMMAILSHPFRSMRTYYRLFIPVLLGCAAGFFGLAGVVDFLFHKSSVITICLFAGLISGTLPSLFREAGKKDSTAASWTGFAISLFAVFALLSFLQNGNSVSITPNIWWFFFCGAVWGLSIVVPGLSSSSILIFVGLYQPMASGIATFDMGVIIPLLAGILFTVVISARFINFLFERYHSVVSHIILGIVIASTLLIIPTGFSGTPEVVFSLILFALGFFAAMRMNKYGERIKGFE